MKGKKIALSALLVIGAAVIAILVHAFLPSPGASVNDQVFDGFLVEKLSFPVVASLYFVILYLHIIIVMGIFGKRELGLRFGLAFGLIYLIGMQEIVVEGSPFEAYGKDFILYQFFMGLGDAVPVVILCIAGSKVLHKKSCTLCSAEGKGRLLTIAIIAALFTTERLAGYYMGYISSDIRTYPVPVIIWTILFGIVLGIAYILVSPVVSNRRKGFGIFFAAVVIIGINWIWFNSFMGLILKDTIGIMLLRSCIDVAAIFIAVWIKHLIVRE